MITLLYNYIHVEQKEKYAVDRKEFYFTFDKPSRVSESHCVHICLFSLHIRLSQLILKIIKKLPRSGWAGILIRKVLKLWSTNRPSNACHFLVKYSFWSHDFYSRHNNIRNKVFHVCSCAFKNPITPEIWQLKNKRFSTPLKTSRKFHIISNQTFFFCYVIG